MMSKTTVRVTVDRAAAILRGVNGTDSIVSVDLDVSKMTPADREQMAQRFRHDKEGAKLVELAVPSGSYEHPMSVVVPTQDGVLEAFARYRQAVADYDADRARQKAEAQALGEAYASGARTETQMVSEYVGVTAWGGVTSYDSKFGCKYLYERQYVHTHYGDEATQAACEARDAILGQESAARKVEARDAAIAELHRKYIQPKLDWVRIYGSQDLRRMIDEGLSTWPDVYHEEHTAWQAGIEQGHLLAERPGWIVLCASEAKKIEPPKRPRARAWMILDQARTVEPDAKLGRYQGKYVAYATYRDQTIIWPAE